MIHTLTGKNSYALHERRTQLVADFVNKAGSDLGLEQYDGADTEVDRLIDALTTLPFLVGERLVVIRDAGANKDFIVQLPKIASRIPETTTVVFVEPGLDKRSELLKILKGLGDLEEFRPMTERDLAPWIEKYVASKGATITSGAVRLLTENSSDQYELAHEVDKLCLWSEKITESSVQLLVERRLTTTIFELLDQLMMGRLGSAIKTLRNLRASRIESGYIMAMLAWQFHLLVSTWSGQKRQADEIARETGFSAFSVRKSQNLTKRLTKAQLRSALRRLTELDTKLKSQRIDEEALFETGLMQLSRDLI